MKKNLLIWVMLLLAGTAQAQVTTNVSKNVSGTVDKQALSKQITQLMRNPKKPHQDLQFALSGCHAQQIIRDNKADVEMSQPVSVSYSKGDSGWGVKLKDGVFEMKLDFEWANVTGLSYERETDDDDQSYYELKIKSQKKGGDSITFDLPLYTTNETVVKNVMQRLEKVRQSCK
ncbi:hypothetical protein [Hymenobacter sp. HDW8]|uniref:hypothetical protein n=1 Tax=Hymenobacter sp. HDW8 TaxID=2714932 RepID=UPI00140CF9ED|nr:hypothetical protein [Hymenobacter sp. HDW8]QIL76169.1 hypothetical protein G7064_10110 [Hymenobacter sp. HDW8]